MTATTVPVAMLRQFLDAFDRHDLDAIMDFFAAECALETPRGPDPWAAAGWGGRRCAGLADWFAGIPDVRYGEDHHWVGDDRGIATRLLTGTTTTGQRLAVRGYDLLEFDGGKVVRKDSPWKLVAGEGSSSVFRGEGGSTFPKEWGNHCRAISLPSNTAIAM